MEEHTEATHEEPVANPRAFSAQTGAGASGTPVTQRQPTEAEQNQPACSKVSPASDPITSQVEAFTDDETLPVFEAALDLPRSLTTAAPTKSVRVKEKGNG